MEPEADSIEVQLYRYTLDDPGRLTPVGTPVTLSADNNWSHTWSGSDVPTKINGQDCYYTVEEQTNGSWNVVVRKNGDVQTGEIALCNIVYDWYKLPSTGGRGTADFALLGGALMTLSLLSGAALAWRRRKEH